MGKVQLFSNLSKMGQSLTIELYFGRILDTFRHFIGIVMAVHAKDGTGELKILKRAWSADVKIWHSVYYKTHLYMFAISDSRCNVTRSRERQHRSCRVSLCISLFVLYASHFVIFSSPEPKAHR